MLSLRANRALVVEEALNSVISQIVLLSENHSSASPEILQRWWSQLDLARLNLLENNLPKRDSPPESYFGSTGE